MPLEELLFQIGAIIVIASGLAMVAHRLRQPLIIAYIVAGVVVGPSLFGIVRSSDMFEALSQMGVAFLLFTIGLGLNWRKVREVGSMAFATGIAQIVLTGILSFALSLYAGFPTVTSLYFSLALTFSSTIIVVKLLMDKEEIDTLYGRIAVGILLVQDFVAMLSLLAIGAMGRGATVSDILLQSVLKGIIMLPILWLVSARMIPRIVAYAARSQELLFLFSVSWCFLVAGLFTWFGFGLEFGALIAGISLSGTVFHREMTTRIRPIRDFFLIIFFIILGTHIQFSSLRDLWVPVLAFSMFVLLAKPMIVMLLTRAFGYHPRTGFLTGVSLAQISEFSFILLGAGIAARHLHPDALALMTGVAVVTIAFSSYGIVHNEDLYDGLSRFFCWLRPACRRSRRLGREKHETNRVIMFGFHRLGAGALETVRSLRRPYLIVDFDPQVIRDLHLLGEPALYGDAADEHFLSELQAEKSAAVISTIPDAGVSLAIISYLRGKRFRGAAVVCARTREDAELCYEAGATYVLVPNLLGGEKFKEMLEENGFGRAAWAQKKKEG